MLIYQSSLVGGGEMGMWAGPKLPEQVGWRQTSLGMRQVLLGAWSSPRRPAPRTFSVYLTSAEFLAKLSLSTGPQELWEGIYVQRLEEESVLVWGQWVVAESVCSEGP